MKIFLFGGAEIGQVKQEVKMIGRIINNLAPRQVLHIPFARIKASEKEWEGDWFSRYIHLAKGIEYLNAQQSSDVSKAKSPLIFISGGGNNLQLIRKVKADKKILKMIRGASCIIGESAGAKILGKYFRSKGSDPASPMIAGLNIIKDTVIEPHYTERQRHKLLLEDMVETKTRYGIGIDAVTALELDTNKFPKNLKKIGVGAVDVKEMLTHDYA